MLPVFRLKITFTVARSYMHLLALGSSGPTTDTETVLLPAKTNRHLRHTNNSNNNTKNRTLRQICRALAISQETQLTFEIFLCHFSRKTKRNNYYLYCLQHKNNWLFAVQTNVKFVQIPIKRNL